LEGKGIKYSSVRTKLNIIKSLFTFAAKLNYIRFNVAAALRIPKANNSLAGRILKQVEVLKLIEKGAKPGRDRALFKLMYATGMRVSEACGLKWCDFYEQDSGEIQVTVLGKGSKLRTILVPPVVWIEVHDLRGKSGDEEPVFKNSKGSFLDRTVAHRIIKEAAVASGVNPKVSC
ncbi:MAG: tyrosine-type recombinase/integrase, partial [Nostoc sp.]